MSNKLAVQNGFLSRCLLAQPESLRGGRFSREQWHDTQALNDYSNHATRALISAIHNSQEQNFEAQRRLLEFDSIAADSWWDYRDECERMGKLSGDYEHAYAQILRSPEHAARIAGVFWEFEGNQDTVIDLQTTERAITIARWYRDEAIRIAGLAKPNESLKRAKRLLEWLIESARKTQANTFKLADVYQKSPKPCKARSRKQAVFLLEILEEHEYGILNKTNFELYEEVIAA